MCVSCWQIQIINLMLHLHFREASAQCFLNKVLWRTCKPEYRGRLPRYSNEANNSVKDSWLWSPNYQGWNSPFLWLNIGISMGFLIKHFDIHKILSKYLTFCIFAYCKLWLNLRRKSYWTIIITPDIILLIM